MLQSQRISQPGTKPYNAAKCLQWSTLGQKNGNQYAKYRLYSAYCHAGINPGHLWYYAVAWAVIALVIGFCFFWQAETRYGRG
jgi:hypothetical protein